VGVAGVFPSTVGVAALAAIALTFDAGLAAVLAGILAGMAVATVISWLHLDAIEQENDYRLYLEDAQRGRGRGRVFSARR
jgi:hypothetical protein